jgi:hypothetical protein
VAGVEGVLPGLRKPENPLIVGKEQNAAAGASQSLISLLERVSMGCFFVSLTTNCDEIQKTTNNRLLIHLSSEVSGG